MGQGLACDGWCRYFLLMAKVVPPSQRRSNETIEVRIVCLPAFNALATMAFVDPLRAANYLTGRHLFHWEFLSTEASPRASNTAALTCAPPGRRVQIQPILLGTAEKGSDDFACFLP
jgi:transcriptional regulator GlxA family with amidase domain